MYNDVINQLFKRKSVRVYTNQPISQEDKQTIIQAALQAPTAGNMCLYSIIDITDSQLKQTLSQTCDNQPFIAQAPMVLIFVADYQKWYDSYCHFYGSQVRKPSYGDFMLAASDALIAAQNAVIAAESLGIGSCYIGDVIENFEQHKALLNLPQYVVPVAMLCFGYPTQQQLERTKPSRFNEKYVVSENQYHRATTTELNEMFQSKSNSDNNIFENTVRRLYDNKWSQPFIEEMSRSMKCWLDEWTR